MMRMTLGSSDRGIVIVFLWVILVVSAPLRVEPCGLAVRLFGEPKLIEAVGEGLAGKGISIDPKDDCTAASAFLSTIADGILIRIVNLHGQTRTQIVATKGAAVSVIDSWVRPELTNSLLKPQDIGSDTEASVEGDAPIEGKTDIWVRPNIELSVGGDGSLWIGARIMGCVSIGPTCIGVASRFARDVGATGESAQFGTNRMSLDALATIEFPFRLRNLSLIPGLAMGGGWVFIHKVTHEYLFATQRRVRSNTFGIRLETILTAVYRLKSRLFLDMSLGVDILPLCRQALTLGTITSIYPRDDEDDYVRNDTTLIAGAPFLYVRFGLGLRHVF